MAEGFSEDELMCSVCLDLLKDPVTVPCGHTYCMRCITDCWNQEDQTRIYRCPQCRKTFSPRPDLAKNVMVDKMLEKLKNIKLADHCDKNKEKQELERRGMGLEEKLPVTSIKLPEPKSRTEFLQYSRQFRLDPNTAYHELRLSEEGRAATFSVPQKHYRINPGRFNKWFQVMCRNCVSAREQCYWEVNWKAKGKFGVSIAVAYKTISRKGMYRECAAGQNDQSWSLSCSPNHYSFFHNNSEMLVSLLPNSSRVGVYVDHSAGILSFYRVSIDGMSLIHRVHTTFTQPLYPMFRVSRNASMRLVF